MQIDCGYYWAFGKKIKNKLAAFASTVPKGHWPHWNFHEEEFSKENWLQEPAESLEQLYMARAEKISKKYDYIIISYTGGADSYNVASSFLKRKLRVDELLHRCTVERIDPSNKSKARENAANESIWAAWPTYLMLKEMQSDLKFNLWDEGKEIVESWKNLDKQSTIYDLNWYAPNTLVKKNIENKIKLPGSKKSPVIVYGLDKPQIFYRDGKFFLTFLDDTIVKWPGYGGIRNEFFYWSVDSAQILIKQGHVIKNWFKKNKNFLWLVSHEKTNKSLYNEIINNLIYPWKRNDIWQPEKDKFKLLNCQEKWFMDCIDNEGRRKWKKIMVDYSNEVKKIYSKNSAVICEKNLEYNVLPGCYSKFYCLGS